MTPTEGGSHMTSMAPYTTATRAEETAPVGAPVAPTALGPDQGEALWVLS